MLMGSVSISSAMQLSPARPRLPDGLRIYAISDVHGCADLLRKMFAVIDKDLRNVGSRRALHVFMGDYIDRGPDSYQTVELLIDRARNHEAVFLKGNHEALLLDAMSNIEAFQVWLKCGGISTLLSYGVRPEMKPERDEGLELMAELKTRIPMHHRKFYECLRPRFACGDFFFVHAGVRPGVALSNQTEEDMLWIREDFLSHDQSFEKYVVHGHTPVRQPDIRPNRANIDTGAYATGNLTLLSVQDDSMLAI
jgi:serine/threonine protein phosphatase 1